MGLDFAIDDLYSAGWSALDTAGCEHSPTGRVYPGIRRIEREFSDAGKRLRVRHMPAFGCYRAEWADTPTNTPEGAVVGSCEAEAAVYALAHLRRQAATVSA